MSLATTIDNIVGSHQLRNRLSMDIPRTSSESCRLAITWDNLWIVYIKLLNHIQVLCMVCAPKWRSMNNTLNISKKKSKGRSMISKILERSFVLNLLEFAVMLLAHMCHAIHYNRFWRKNVFIFYHACHAFKINFIGI